MTAATDVALNVDAYTWRTFSRYLWWSQHPWAGVVPAHIAHQVGPGKDVSINRWLDQMVVHLAEDISGQYHRPDDCEVCW